jgi:membrane protease YdiL (CAAX protease family)
MDARESPQAAPPKISFFREVRWRWSDVAICGAPSLVLRLIALMPVLVSFWHIPRWFQPAVEAVVLVGTPILGLIATRWVFFIQTALEGAWSSLLPIAIATRRLGRGPRWPGPGRIVFELFWAIATVPVVMIGVGLASPWLARLVGETLMPVNPIEPIAGSSDPIDRWFLIFWGVCVAPLVEEVLFRGVLYNRLRQSLPVALAIPVQAMAFGLMHPFDIANEAAVALIGLALGLLYEWRRTLLAPILLHAAINSLAFFLISQGLTPYANSPMLGISGDLGDRGCVVLDVAPDSAAEKAGLQIGDIITAVEKTKVSDLPSIARIVRTKKIGDEISIEYLRGARTRTVVAVLQRRQQRR